MTTFQDMLTEQMEQDCTEQIVQEFKQQASPENLEIDFHVSKGKMLGTTDDINSRFKFDVKDDSPIGKIKKEITQLIENDELTRQDSGMLINFQNNVCKRLEKDDNRNEIANVLRGEAGLNAPDWLIPLNTIVFHSFEISTDIENGHILRIHKKPNSELSENENLAQDIIQIHKTSGKDFEQILKEKKSEGAPGYEKIESLELVRYIYDVHLDFAGDYSFCEPQEALAEDT